MHGASDINQEDRLKTLSFTQAIKMLKDIINLYLSKNAEANVLRNLPSEFNRVFCFFIQANIITIRKDCYTFLTYDDKESHVIHIFKRKSCGSIQITDPGEKREIVINLLQEFRAKYNEEKKRIKELENKTGNSVYNSSMVIGPAQSYSAVSEDKRSNVLNRE